MVHNKRTKRKLNQRKTKRKIKRKTNRLKINKKQRGGNFNDRELAELTTLLKSIGFTEEELHDFISKSNDMSQFLTKKNGFDNLIYFIQENHLHDKQGLINWVNALHTRQMQLEPETDNEDSDDE
jgi:hypothetical protein